MFVDVLLLFSRYPVAEVKKAVKTCVKRCAFSYEAVCATLDYVPRKKRGPLDLSSRPDLLSVGSGMRPAKVYDALMAREASA